MENIEIKKWALLKYKEHLYEVIKLSTAQQKNFFSDRTEEYYVANTTIVKSSERNLEIIIEYFLSQMPIDIFKIVWTEILKLFNELQLNSQALYPLPRGCFFKTVKQANGLKKNKNYKANFKKLKDKLTLSYNEESIIRLQLYYDVNSVEDLLYLNYEKITKLWELKAGKVKTDNYIHIKIKKVYDYLNQKEVRDLFKDLPPSLHKDFYSINSSKKSTPAKLCVFLLNYMGFKNVNSSSRYFTENGIAKIIKKGANYEKALVESNINLGKFMRKCNEIKNKKKNYP